MDRKGTARVTGGDRTGIGSGAGIGSGTRIDSGAGIGGGAGVAGGDLLRLGGERLAQIDATVVRTGAEHQGTTEQGDRGGHGAHLDHPSTAAARAADQRSSPRTPRRRGDGHRIGQRLQRSATGRWRRSMQRHGVLPRSSGRRIGQSAMRDERPSPGSASIEREPRTARHHTGSRSRAQRPAPRHNHVRSAGLLPSRLHADRSSGYGRLERVGRAARAPTRGKGEPPSGRHQEETRR